MCDNHDNRDNSTHDNRDNSTHDNVLHNRPSLVCHKPQLMQIN